MVLIPGQISEDSDGSLLGTKSKVSFSTSFILLVMISNAYLGGHISSVCLLSSAKQMC